MQAIETKGLVKKYKNLTAVDHIDLEIYQGELFSLLGVNGAGKLSGGWQRRVSIAMALISEPKILFLDEPTLGLDVLARYELWDVIRSLKGKITIIMTTHYMEEAKELSDRIGIMKDGRLLAVGNVEELNQKAGTDDFDAAFSGGMKDYETYDSGIYSTRAGGCRLWAVGFGSFLWDTAYAGDD